MLDQQILDELNPDALEKLARSLERQARTLRLHAQDRRARADTRRRQDKAIRGLMALPHILTHHLDAGMSYDAAVSATARESGEPPETVEARFRVWLKGEDYMALQARRLAVARMAPYASNLEIAARLGVHRNTVSKDLKRTLRD